MCDVGPCLLGVLHDSASRVCELRFVDLPAFLWRPMEKCRDLAQEIKSWCFHRPLVPEVFTGHFIGVWYRCHGLSHFVPLFVMSGADAGPTRKKCLID